MSQLDLCYLVTLKTEASLSGTKTEGAWALALVHTWMGCRQAP